MGKAEQYKFERKLMQEQFKKQSLQREDRHKLFFSGLLIGAIGGLLVGGLLFRGSKPAAISENLKISTNSGSFNPQITVPNNLQISQPTPTPGGFAR